MIKIREIIAGSKPQFHFSLP